MIVVADAGPLMALAKINGLEALRQLYSPIFISPAVYQEAIARGLALGAEDAAQLETEYKGGVIEVRTPSLTALPRPALLGPGETESICLAIELRADWLLVDDHDARRSAEGNFAAAGVATATQGTLGVIVSTHRQGHLSGERAIEMIQAIKGRPDIWISAQLCDQVIDTLTRLA